MDACSILIKQSIEKLRIWHLTNDYLHNEGIRDRWCQLMALSLMPINEVENQFQRLETIISTALSDLITYFKHQWPYGVVPMQIWNFHTTNGCVRINEPLSILVTSLL